MNSKELAKLIGVSQSTISRALNGSPQISEQRRQEIVELAKKHNFEFNLNARNLRNQTSSFVGILLPDYFSSFIKDVYRSTQFNYLYEELSKRDLDLVLLSGDELFNDASALERAIKKRQLAGLILWGRIKKEAVIKYLKTLRIPVLAMTRCNEMMKFLPSVSVNSYQQGYLMGEHFASRGYRRIGTIRHSFGSVSMITEGFRDALKDHGIILDDSDILVGGIDYHEAYDTVMRSIDRIRTYDAIFTQSDTMAIGTMTALKESGLSIPDDIALAGNDNTPMAKWSSPSLTSIEPFVQHQAQVTSRRISSMIHDGVDPVEEKHYVITPKLVIRESCP